MTDKIELTPEEAQQVAQQFYGAAPIPEEEKGTNAFLKHVAKAKDTTRTGFVTEEELGQLNLPIRTLKELSLFCSDVANKKTLGEYFDEMAQIATATSLAKEGFLTKLAVVTRRETSSSILAPERKTNKGWFKKKKT